MLNNLETKKWLYVVLAILLVMLGLIGLATLGFDIPVLRQIVGFIFLTFVPGFLILRILKLHRLGTVESLLYSVGLSIAFVMFLGLFINMLYPAIGISKPISILPVMASITFVMLIFGVIAYKQKVPQGKPLSQSHSIRWSELLSPPTLFLFLLPVLSALGTRLVYLHQGNTVLLILLSLIALVAVLVAFGKFIPAKLYPLAIIAISIALLWHWSLISLDIPASDVSREYYYQILVLNNSIWNSGIGSNLNAMLSIVMLGPIYSLMLNLDMAWVIKIVYTLLFSLVPLALFQAYRRQTGDKIAFLGAFFFMSMPVFFTLTPGVRQPIAEVFLALTILLLLSKEIAATQRTTLLIIFGFSIVVSHYGLAYIFMFYLLMALPLLLLWRISDVEKLWKGMMARLSRLWHSASNISWSPKPASASLQKSPLTPTYVLLFIVFGLGWYMYVSLGYPFYSIVGIVDYIYSNVVSDFLVAEAMDPHVRQAVGLVAMRGKEVEWEIARIVQYFTQLFIVVGIIGLVVTWHRTKFHSEYIAMSLVSMVLIAISIVLPYFAQALTMMRIYHITLFFLAPFCVLGGIAVSRWLFRVLQMHRLRKVGTPAHLNLVVILVLVPYFLFGNGFIFELTGATPTSKPLSLYKTDWEFLTKPEIYARTWLAERVTDNGIVHSDAKGLLHRGPGLPLARFPRSEGQVSPNSYIFLRRWNVIHGEWRSSVTAPYSRLEKLSYLNGMNKIYDSGDAQILRP